MNPDQVKRFNREAWDREVARGNKWTRPVSGSALEAARSGEWQVVLTMSKPVPRSWFGRTDSLAGLRILCLASGGGQQGPLLAAAGAEVLVLDASEAQLAADEALAREHGLDLVTEQGFMDDLSSHAAGSFDLVFHPVSNTFAPELCPVWREALRVLRPGGALLAGFMNPDLYLFDETREEAAEGPEDFVVVRRLPYVGRYEDGPIEHSHTMDTQLGELLGAGFLMTDFYTDGDPERLLGEYMPLAFALRAIKPSEPGAGSR